MPGKHISVSMRLRILELKRANPNIEGFEVLRLIPGLASHKSTVTTLLISLRPTDLFQEAMLRWLLTVDIYDGTFPGLLETVKKWDPKGPWPKAAYAMKEAMLGMKSVLIFGQRHANAIVIFGERAPEGLSYKEYYQTRQVRGHGADYRHP